MNHKYKTRFTAIATAIGLSFVLLWFSLPAACLVAGLPAIVGGGFALLMALALMTHKGPWH